MHRRRELLDPAGEFVQAITEEGIGLWRLLGQQVQLDGQEGEALVQVVMQFAGDPPSLLFLGMDQSTGQGPQFPLALPQSSFRPTSAGSFHQEPENQKGLNHA